MEKILKVCQTAQGNRYTSKINIAGDWLKKYGFNLGDLVKVEIRKNEIVISKNPNTDVLTAFNARIPQMMKLIENLDLTL